MIPSLKRENQNKNYELLFKKYTMRQANNKAYDMQSRTMEKFTAINKFLRKRKRCSIEECKREQTKNKERLYGNNREQSNKIEN